MWCFEESLQCSPVGFLRESLTQEICLITCSRRLFCKWRLPLLSISKFNGAMFGLRNWLHGGKCSHLTHTHPNSRLRSSGHSRERYAGQQDLDPAQSAQPNSIWSNWHHGNLSNGDTANEGYLRMNLPCSRAARMVASHLFEEALRMMMGGFLWQSASRRSRRSRLHSKSDIRQ